MSEATATAGALVQGPAAPSFWDLIWTTGQTQAANEDPRSTRATREVAAAAEQAAFRAAQHIGLDDPTPTPAPTPNSSSLRHPPWRPACDPAQNGP